MMRHIAAAGMSAAVLLSSGMAWAQDKASDVLGDLPVIGAPHPKGIAFQPASSPEAIDQQWLDHYVLVIITVVTVFVCGLLLWCILRYNRRANPVPSKTSPAGIGLTMRTPVAGLDPGLANSSVTRTRSPGTTTSGAT